MIPEHRRKKLKKLKHSIAIAATCRYNFFNFFNVYNFLVGEGPSIAKGIIHFADRHLNPLPHAFRARR